MDDSAGWKYELFRQTSTGSGKTSQTADGGESDRFSVSQGGIYTCRGWRSDPDAFTPESDAVIIEETVSNKAVVTLQPNGPLIYSGETITVRCEIGGRNTRWEYEWRVNNTNISHKDHEYKIIRASVSHSGDYRCKGRKDSYYSTEWSDVSTLTVSSNKPKPTLTADKTIIPVGGSVTLTCSVDGSADWKYDWFRQTSESSEAQLIRNVNPNRVISVYQGGIYYCRGGRGDSVFYTENSNKVTIQETVSNKAVVTLQPNWPLIYSGETITVRCEIEGGEDTGWEYKWRVNNRFSSQKDKEFRISASSSSNVNFMCKGRRYLYSSTEWSEAVILTRSFNKAKSTLRADSDIIPVGGSVTLTCSVDSSADWKYYWFREYSALQSIRNVKPVNKVSEGGIYQCRAGRGDPEIFTEFSSAVTVWKTVPNKTAVVTLQPNSTEIYSGETIMLRCEIHDGDTEWEYEWKSPRYTSSNKNEYMISYASSYDSGNYRCRGRKMKNAEYNSTEWSADIKLTVSDNKPASVLTVSPLWLSPGDSVTLSCEVEHPSAGWRFYWYKIVPKLSDNSYIYELLPGSINGTEQDSYIIHGPTHTAGYMCRAGRGDPVYYTQYSKPGFVWSGDVHSAVTLKVSPDIVQHFTNDSVSLSCEGNFTKWRVRSFPEDYSDCYNWRFMTGSTCNIKRYQQSDAVYWCESGSGEFSNAVNITIQNDPKILTLSGWPIQSESTNQDSATHHMVNLNETQDHIYNSLLHGDVCVYESIRGSEDPENGKV
ncbi:basement membrane-specific heparan sulfate proteoglycan core protein-like [Scomber scombrus]|uniref:basement membrane-specific heparan sulfate proteoglycan core protein-like n=1 Tax=Scomber scombrus TaxID=13677 RepID=UPI002DDB9CAD|nr:basement membrane-specific heparan sulfate proteoglycan core protein-like [Scomber scombrus]